MSFNVYWGDSHLNLHHRDRDYFEQSFQAAREHLDFLPIAYYPMEFYATDKGLRIESWHNRPKFLDEWEQIQELCRQFHEPGKFVTFPGYEWHGNRTRWGDHNVYYFSEGNPLDDADDIDDLYEHLRERRGIAIPHHIGYRTANRAKDWDHYDPAVSPFAETYSNHGCSETAVNRFPQPNVSMGPWASGSTMMDALARGLRVGITCSGDSHNRFPGVYNSGLMGVWAEALTRESLWDAFLARRLYGVTGDRIVLEYHLNDAPMGSTITATGPVTARVRVVCPQALDRIELIRNNRVLKTYCHLDGLEPSDADPVRCRFRVEPGWGPQARYGPEVVPKEWQGRVSLSEGELSLVHGCWQDFGNRVTEADDRTVHFETRTVCCRERPTQPFILEARAPRAARISVEAEPFDVSFSLEDALSRTQLWVDTDGAKRHIEEQFGYKPEELENPDVFYHNAYKLRVCQAVREDAFSTQAEFTDPDPPSGTSWYYVRASQVNGQMAWSSPVWVERQ